MTAAAETPEAAVAQFLEALDLGAPVFTILPPSQGLPYVLVHPPYASPTDPTSAPHAVGGKKRVVPELQVDIYQHALNTESSTGVRSRAFDAFLAELVATALANAKLGPGPARIWGCSVTDGPRTIPNPLSTNVIHQVVAVRMHRSLAAVRP